MPCSVLSAFLPTAHPCNASENTPLQMTTMSKGEEVHLTASKASREGFQSSREGPILSKGSHAELHFPLVFPLSISTQERNTKAYPRKTCLTQEEELVIVELLKIYPQRS